MRLPFVSRARHDATVARLIAERNRLAKDLAASEAELAGVSEKWTDTAIVNDCLTEDLVKVRKQLADSQEVEGALAKQIHEMAQPVEPTDAEMDSLNRLIEERDREKRRPDHLQRQLDDAVGLPPDRVEDSSRWQPGYEKSGVDAS